MIIESGNDYVIGVKKNQPALYNRLEEVMGDTKQICSSYITLEVNRGRTELRQIKVSNAVASISEEWAGLKQVVSVCRIVKRKEKVSREEAYFISSRQSNALLYEEGIRLHWQIENSLHYVKDVTLQEDDSTIRTGNAPQNISTIKNIAINILRNNNKQNMAQAIRMVAHDFETLRKLIA